MFYGNTSFFEVKAEEIGLQLSQLHMSPLGFQSLGKHYSFIAGQMSQLAEMLI